MEIIRFLILLIGWPILVSGSIFLMAKAIRFWRAVNKNVIGRLVLIMVGGWLITMYSLGIVATAYMFADPAGVVIVVPIFFLWVLTMGIITYVVVGWSKEAIALNAFYRELEGVVEKKTAEIEAVYAKQLQQERELRQFRERFVFIAAHELRLPLTAVRWGLTSIVEDAELKKKLPKDARELLAGLLEKNQQLTELVEDLLNVARIQSGNQKDFQKDNVSLSKAASNFRSQIESLAKEKKVSCEWDILDQKLPAVRGDEVYVQEVMKNLLVNAIRYNKRGGLVRIYAEVRSKEREVIVRVRDTGIGISPKDIPELFQEFYRVESPETKKIQGTGLGLFITKQLVERMGGRIWVESEKDVGSVFSFALAIVQKK